MAWLIAGAGAMYVLNDAYNTVHENTVGRVNTWLAEREKDQEEQARKERDERWNQRHKETLRKHNEIRRQYNIPIKEAEDDSDEDKSKSKSKNKSKSKTDFACWSPFG